MLPFALCLYLTLSSEADLYQQVERSGGGALADRQRSHPFKYAQVLLAVQRLGSAVAHLWRSGSVDAAVHVLAVGLYYGIVSPGCALDEGMRAHSPVSSPVAAEDVLRLWTRSRLLPMHASNAADYILYLGLFGRHGVPRLPVCDEGKKLRMHGIRCQLELLSEVLETIGRDQVGVEW